MSAVFTRPSWQRLLVALAYAVAVAAAVWAVEAPGPIPPTPVNPPEASSSIVIRATATFPVGRWTVLVDGMALEGIATAQTWSGKAVGHEVLVQAERLDAADQSPGAVRLDLGSRSTLAWGEGTVSATAMAAQP